MVPKSSTLQTLQTLPTPPTSSSFAARRNRRFAASCFALGVGLLLSAPAFAQTPLPVPATMTTIAGLSPMSATVGTQCPNLPTGVKSTDAYGDGCLAVNAILGAAGRGGVQVDTFGNLFIDDDVNSIVHVVNPTTGIMTVLAGKGTVCTTGKITSAGDGCIAATQTITSSQRGIGIDPYGNVLLAGYGDNLVHLVCRNASPNCAAAQVGYMKAVAGCVTTLGSGASGGLGASNVAAFTTGSTCSVSLDEVGAPRGAAGDIYGNIFFADTNNSRWRVVVGPLTSTYFTGNNPLYAALGVVYPSVTAGFAYTVVNLTGGCAATYGGTCGGTATVKGNACSVTTNSVTYTGTALDVYGDGCPFNSSSDISSSGYTSGLTVDLAGNMVFADPTNGVRVFFVSGSGTAGAAMVNAIKVNNTSVTTPQAGFVYTLVGGGTLGLTATPQLGSAITGTAQSSTTSGAFDSAANKIQVTPQGNIYVGDSTKVIFLDMTNGYVRQLLTTGTTVAAGSFCSGTSGQKSLSAYSDGCPVANSAFSNSNGLGIATDTQSNLYLYDASAGGTGMLVRKVLAQTDAPRTIGTALIQNYTAHFPEASAGTLTATATLSAGTEDTAAAPTCSAQNADFSFDCTAAVTSTPIASGIRSQTLSQAGAFTPSAGSPATTAVNFNLGGSASGNALVFDNASSTVASTTTPINPTTANVFTGIKPVGAALDGAGNLYTMDTTGQHFLESVAGTTYTLPGTLPTNPAQLAVDNLGNVFAVGSGTASITELAVNGVATAGAPPTRTATTLSYTPLAGTATPTAVATDVFGNVFVADHQSSAANTAIFRLSTLPGSLQSQATVATGFGNIASLAVDPSGNVYAVDTSVPAVYKLTPGLNAGIPGYVQTTVTITPATAPVTVATDAAGDVYIQDAGTGKLYEIPVTGSTTPIFSSITTATGIAVDGAGNTYSADSTKTSVTQVIRNATAFSFGTAQNVTYAGTLSNIGNLAVTGQNTTANPNTTNFAIVGGATTPCTFASNVLGAVAIGNACTLSATFIGNGSGTVTDAITFAPATTTGSLTLSGTLTGTAIGTTTIISSQTPANPQFSSGTEVTFTVTVAPASGSTAPGGNVSVTVTNTVTAATTTNNYALTTSGTSGVATVALSALPAGSYTISAAYPTSGSFTASSSGNTAFTIAQNSTTTSWTPGSLTQQFSAPIGTANLNASATYNSVAVPGTYVYTANGAEINAASYLAIGTYSLGVTFYPTDAIDYSTSTASVPTYTVTKASTTAAVGSTQNLVASDGTGNFTSVQTAINALPATGGKVYIKPGTYTGFVTVVTPSVSLYGLGGNPANVVLTNEDGAFSSPYPAGAGPGNNGSQGDQGSSTVVVARGAISGVNGGATYTPTNFYAENFSMINTYDTSSTLDANLYSSGTGLCTGGNTPTARYLLYNAGTLCNSQALAIWITGDQAVLNNVYTTSQQDTIYAGSISTGSQLAARQYWFRGKVTGDVDYIFGDAAAVFDRTTIYSTYHGTSTGTVTIHAQNKAQQTGSASDYLSGYVMNSNVFTSQSSGMNNLYFGRPYGVYSTWVMLNSYIDQVIAAGYTPFGTTVPLTSSTYLEYNNQTYTDPATNAADLNGVPYLGTGGSTGSGVTGTRETSSTNPGTVEVASTTPGFQNNFPTLANTKLSQIEAQPFYPIAFLGSTVASNPYNNGVTNWNPTTAIASGSNAFATAGVTTVAGGVSVTILMRPQTPGLGAVTNGTYTIPTGTYSLSDTYNSATTVIASGTLDAAGEAYFTSSSLGAGSHSLSWTYSGDSNFSGSTTASPLALTVTAASTTTTLAAAINPITYGQSASITATVSAASGTPTGTVTLTIDGTATQNASLSSGAATFTVTGLTAGAHSFSAAYAGAGAFSASSTATNLSFTVNKAVVTVTGSCANRPFDTVNSCTSVVTNLQNSDTVATVFTTTPGGTTSALRNSPAGTYTATPTNTTLTAFGSANYTLSAVNGTFSITGGVPQSILFNPVPNFVHGNSYQLTARTTSGLPVAYAVTNGPATISGTTLTVNGTGSVSVQATTPTDPTGDYATAPPVTVSFTAQ